MKPYKNYILTKCPLVAFVVLIELVTVVGCDDLLDVERPTSLIPSEVVFRDDVTATTAVTGIYAGMMNTGNFASGSIQSTTSLGGLLSDEFINHLPSNFEYGQFFSNDIQANNSLIATLWGSAYQTIYQANAAIVGLQKSSTISVATKNQLLGEAFFIRAFCHFYLANTFGDIPIILGIDYRENNAPAKSNVGDVYRQVISDLLEAQTLLVDQYPSSDRVRPNKATATSLLARAYLYTSDWRNAEIQSSLVINNIDYGLESDLNAVFLASSREAIWQLRQTSRTVNTWEGNYFILTGSPQFVYLRGNFVESFESGDARAVNWIRSATSNGVKFFYPFKYKVRRGGPGSSTPVPLTEYSMVFRLAEQYLIRAEAHAQLGKLNEAINDVDSVRQRASLPLIQATNPSIGKEELLLAIEAERSKELFTEWGHRWFDLKRTGRVLNVLGLVKPGLTELDMFCPIPEQEVLKNPRLAQ